MTACIDGRAGWRALGRSGLAGGAPGHRAEPRLIARPAAALGLDCGEVILPNMIVGTVGGRTHLREARWTGGAPIHTLEALGEHLADDAEGRTLDDCGSLRGRRDRLLNAVDALVQQRVVPHGGSSIRLPKGEDVRLLVTLQTEPLGGRVYAAGGPATLKTPLS